MDKVTLIYSSILCAASFISAAGVIIAFVKKTKDSSLNRLDTYLDERLRPTLDNIQTDIKDVRNELDSARMQTLRYDCLKFASDVRSGYPKTRREYEEIFRMEEEYEELIAKHEIKNGFMKEEMLFVHEHYKSLDNL